MFGTSAGPIGTLGWFTLGTWWLVATRKANNAALEKRYTAHEEWVTRSYALAFGAVTIRLQLIFLIVLTQGDFMPLYALTTWTGWIPNLLIAEFFIRRARRNAEAAKKSTIKVEVVEEEEE